MADGLDFDDPKSTWCTNLNPGPASSDQHHDEMRRHHTLYRFPPSKSGRSDPAKPGILARCIRVGGNNRQLKTGRKMYYNLGYEPRRASGRL